MSKLNNGDKTFYKMKKIYVLLSLFLVNFSLYAANYDAQEVKQLIAFLNQKSAEEGKTNAQALGITLQPTEANTAE